MTRRLAGILAIIILLAGIPPATRTAAAPPTGFTETIVPGLDQLPQPTAFAFLPDGAMLIATKAGRLRLYQGGVLRAAPVFDRTSTICSNSERGLLGVAVDPEFAANRFVYVYYTFNKFGTPNPCPTNSASDPVNRVSRLKLTAELTTEDETVLVDNIPSPNGNHNAGDLQFGKDGYLYISTGDGGTGGVTARQLHNLDGAILRITRDGDIPADNPFQGAGSARCNTGPATAGTKCREIFAYGFRNPFRIAFDPNAAGTRFFINDVGQGSVEEISEGVSGGDYGWNCFEGTRVNRSDGDCAGLAITSTVQPTFEYRRDAAKPPSQPAHFDGCASITGGAFVPGGLWPSAYDGAYLFGDYVCGRLFVRLAAGGSELFDGAAGAVTHMAFGPFGETQAFYYADIGAGDIVRVVYSGGANRSPVARVVAQPDFGAPPLEVSFDASASSDPDSGDSIVAYIWNFGDGSAPRETAGPTTSHTYGAPGKYEAQVRARDSSGAISASPATARIDVGNEPPTAQITAPTAGARFSVGEQLTLRGAGSDPEDGALGGERLSWEVRRHHDAHFHPYLSATGAEVTLTAPAPEDLAAVGSSWLEVILTATDSRGRASTPVTVEIRPRIVSLRFETEPPGLRVSVNDRVATSDLTTPAAVQSWPGWALTLGAPERQSAGGVEQKLCGWRHGGAPSHSFITPSAATTALRAIFAPASEPCPAQVGDEVLYLPMTRR